MTTMWVRTPKITAYSDETNWRVEPCDGWRPWFNEVQDGWKSCLPFAIATQMGWVVRCPYAFRVAWMGHHGKDDLIVEAPDEAKKFVSSHFGSGILTFGLPVKFVTNRPYGLIVTGPFNTVKSGIHPLAGYVETHWSPYTFTMNWKMAIIGQWVTFEKDEAVCMILPYDAGLLNRTHVEQKPTSLAPNSLRKRFAAWRLARSAHLEGSDPTIRDRLYLQGKCPITKLKMAKDHLIKLSLKKFTN